MNKKVKWVGILSTAERNHIGLIRVRQNNVNSEVLGFEIIDGNGEPYDLKNRKVLFCTYFDRFAPVEQYAEVIENGKIIYTMNEHDMQKPVRINFAYFKIMDDKDNLVDTTQNFSYDIMPSIESKCGDFGAYIIRLEEVLDAFNGVKDEAMKEIQQIIKDFNENVIEQQKEFDEWFSSVKEIIESIDPGGVLLSEIIAARDKEKDLKTRLERDKKQLLAQIDLVKNEHYLTKIGEINKTRTLIDNDFSKNHTVTKINEVDVSLKVNPIIIATVDDNKQDRFKLRKVGVI